MRGKNGTNEDRREHPLISVILPVCNPGPGIRRCLNTLRGQTLQRIEMIFVDDGCSDESMEIVRNAAGEDSRISILTNPANLGAGPSRNAGIEAARGEYLSFVDPDDYVAPDFLELLYTKAVREQAEIVKGTSVTVPERDGAETDAEPLDTNDRIRKGLAAGVPLFCCFLYEHQSALYRRDFVTGAGIRYGNSRNGQDTTFLLQAAYAAKRFCLEDRATYLYVAREGSAVRRYDGKRLQNQLTALREQMGILESMDEEAFFVHEYAYTRILYCLQLGLYLREHGLDLEIAQFLQALRREVLRLSFCHILEREYPEIRALVNYGECMPTSPLRPLGELIPEEEVFATVSNWSRISAAHPDLFLDREWGLSLAARAARELLIRQTAQQTTAPEEGDRRIAVLADLLSEQDQLKVKMNLWRRMKPKISVIIPVYDPGDGISRCIASLRTQTLEDIELLFIDDRGSDEAMETVRQAARDDPRIRILTNRENLGPGESRNRGISAARGEYLSFVDADDCVACDFLERLYEKAAEQDADIVKGVYCIVREDGAGRSIPAGGFLPDAEPDLSLPDRIRQGLAEGKPLYSLFLYEHQSALYRREFLNEHGIRYGSTRNGEDVTFLLRACHACRAFALAEDARYYYVLRKGSADRTFSEVRLDNQLEAIHDRFSFLITRQERDEAAVTYVFRMLEYALKLQVRAANTPGLESAAEAFLRGLRQEALRLPFTWELVNHHLDLFALITGGANLCPRPLTPFGAPAAADDWIVIVRNWKDYLLGHPGIWARGRSLVNAVIGGALQFYAERLTAGDFSEENDRFYRAVIRERDELKTAEAIFPSFRIKVSVVLPVYNPGPWIARCIRSLRAQRLKEIEMIFVDDGCTDGSMDAVRDAAAQDPRIRIITNPENLGPGPSRNIGIRAARGEYVSFVDPDDFVGQDFLEVLYNRAITEGTDIVKGMLAYIPEGEELDAAILQTRCRSLIQRALREGRPLWTAFAWEHQSALYRRDFLLASGASYGTSRNAQDVTFLLRACWAAESFAMKDEARYYYVGRNGSAVHTYTTARFRNEIDAVREQFAFLAETLAGNPDAVNVAAGKVKYLLRLHIRIFGLSADGEEGRAQLYAIRREVMKLPFRNRLARADFFAAGLIRYGCNLCTEPFASFWEEPSDLDYLAILSNWMGFAAEYPELVHTRPYREMFAAVQEAARLRGPEEQGETCDPAYAAYYQEDMNRLETIGTRVPTGDPDRTG